MADPTRSFALTFVDELIRHGVRHAVVAPGSRSTPIALALAERHEIRLHVRIDERSASFLALGIAKASRQPVPVLCTSGTAAAHFLAAALEADQSGVPLLLVTADRPPELRGTGANQTIDQVGLYGGAVRWACDVGVAEDRPDAERYCRSVVARAVQTARGRSGLPAGPVHVNLPLREPLVPRDEAITPPAGEGKPDRLRVLPGGPVGQDPAVRLLRERLGETALGVVVAGFAGDRGFPAVGELAAVLRWPVIAEPHSGLRHAELALRATDALLSDESFTQRYRPELVLVIGRVGLSRALLSWLATVPHIVIDPLGGWPDVTRTAEAVHHFDPHDLFPLAPQRRDDAWLDAWHAASQQAAQAVDKILDESEELSEPRVARDVADLIPDRSNLVVASSMPIRDLDLVMRPRPIQVFANRGVSGIDGFVSTVQGIALADPGNRTVALAGDLSMLHDVNGLLPGPDQRPDVTYVVINNDGGGIFSLLPQGSAVQPHTFERLFGTPHGVDFARLAAAYGCHHTLVRTAGELREALEPQRGVRIVEVRTDRAANAALHQRLREAAAQAVRPQ